MEGLPITIPVDGGTVAAELAAPAGARGLVLFVHGSGSSHHSPRNKTVADTLQAHGFATLLFDLCTPGEQGGSEPRFDLGHLTQRVLRVIDWVDKQTTLQGLPLTLYGSSSGAAIAVLASVASSRVLLAVVSRAGRVDLAFKALATMRCPLLLQVGELDLDVLELNAWAESHLRTRHELQVIPGATHLFSEPGTLALAAEQSAAWLERELDVRQHQSFPADDT